MPEKSGSVILDAKSILAKCLGMNPEDIKLNNNEIGEDYAKQKFCLVLMGAKPKQDEVEELFANYPHLVVEHAEHYPHSLRVRHVSLINILELADKQPVTLAT